MKLASRLSLRLPHRFSRLALLALLISGAMAAVNTQDRSRTRSLLRQKDRLLAAEEQLNRVDRNILQARQDELTMLSLLRPVRLDSFENHIEAIETAAQRLAEMEGELAIAPDLALLLKTLERYQNSVAATAELQREMGFQSMDGALDLLHAYENQIQAELEQINRSPLVLQFVRLQLQKQDFSRSLNMGLARQIRIELARLRTEIEQEPLAIARKTALLEHLDRYQTQLNRLLDLTVALELTTAHNELQYQRLLPRIDQLQQSMNQRLDGNTQALLRQQRNSIFSQSALAVLGLAVLSALAILQARSVRHLVQRLKLLAQQMQTVSPEQIYPAPALPRELFQSDDEVSTLAEAFGEMSAQIHQQFEQIRQESQRAEVASRAKSDFLAHMSHEIRTPLNGVIGMTDLLQQTPLTPQQREYAQAAQSSSELLLAVINDILDFSKIEAGKMELELGRFDLFGCVEAALEIVRAPAIAKNLPLRCHWDEAVPRWIVGDRIRLLQILVNLLSNAVKFTSTGEIVVTVTSLSSAQTSPGEPATLEFAVRDSGIGIASASQDQLFELFSQVDSATAQAHGGTGLGLAICRRLVEMMDGQIWVESQPDQGATFSFRVTVEVASAEVALPTQALSAQALSAQALPAQALSAQALPTPTLERPRILLAEDSAFNQKIALGILANLGHSAEAVSNGRAALERVQQQSYDIILMDVRMPEMDGLEATRRIIQWFEQLDSNVTSPAARPYIIALTASATEGDRQNCFDAGMDDYMSKPFSPQAMREALDRWLARPDYDVQNIL